MDDQSITQWMLALREGDPEAASLLWGRFAQRVQALARRRLNHAARQSGEAEDIAQSALFALWRSAEEGRLDALKDRDELWRFLAVVTCRKAADAARRKARLAPEQASLDAGVFLEGALRWIADDDEDTVARELDLAGRELLASLDPWLARIVLLRFEGRSNEEIAAIENKSVRTIERYLTMARQRWERELA